MSNPLQRVLLSFPIILFALSLVGAARANQVVELSFAHKKAQSDLIVIGKVTSLDAKPCLHGDRCAQVRIATVLKGPARNGVVVLYEGMVAELDPLCCRVGTTYLFFLQKVRKGVYASVNGPFGIYRIVLSGDGD